MKEAVFNYLVTNKAIFVYLGETNKHSSQIQLMYTLSIQDKQIHSLTHWFFFPLKDIHAQTMRFSISPFQGLFQIQHFFLGQSWQG